MSSVSDDKCLVCLKTGSNLNIFNTYNVRNINEKEELYVDVIKNCFNIEISPDSGLTALCDECSMKLKKAYNFRHEILQAIEKLISAQATVTNEKLYSEMEYLKDIPFATDYDIDTVLESETSQMAYTLDEIYNDKEINENNESSYLLHLDNDAVVDKVLFNNSNDNVSEIIQTSDIDIGIDRAGSELDLEPNASYLLDKPVESYSINILSDILLDNDLEPGEIRVIDKTDKHYLIDAQNDIIVDKKKVIIKSKGKTSARGNNVVKTMLNQEAVPVDNVDNVLVDSITHLVDEVIDEKNEVSKCSIDTKYVTINMKKDKTVLNQAETLDKLNAKDLIMDKKKFSKRLVKAKQDTLSLLAQICTKQQNPDENTVNKTVLNQAETLDKLNTKDLIMDKKKVSKRLVKAKRDELSLLAQICTKQQNPDENTVNKTVLNQAETLDKLNTKDLIKDKKKVSKRLVKAKRDELSLLAQICTKQQNPDENTVNKTVLNQAETLDKLNTKDLIKDKKKVSKRLVKAKRDELSLLAQICTKQQNPDENTVKTVNEINEQKTKDEPTLMDTDVGDKNASKESKSKKRSKNNAGKKEASVKENVSGNVEEVKAKKPRKEKKPKPPSHPFTLRPDQTICDLCCARFETSRALSNHMNTHYPQFVCGECGLELATKNRLRQHLRTHDQGPFLCKVCDKQFSNSNTRNAHTWRVHSKGDPFKCRHCGERFPTYLQRLRHMQNAHGETPEYVCQFCQAKFAYAANRTKHVRTMHLNERPHRCQHCPSAFARARNLAAHLASKHGEGEKSYRCPTCGISFFFRSALRWHVSLHMHKYPCNQCDQKFATSAELESHTRIHEHADNMAINLDFVTSLHLDALADDYALIDPSYLDLNEL